MVANMIYHVDKLLGVPILTFYPAFIVVQPFYLLLFFFFLMIRHPPRSPLFPSTPLFRSSILRNGRRAPRLSRRFPMEADASPFPSDDPPPPVTKMNFAMPASLLFAPHRYTHPPRPRGGDRKSTRLNSSH